MQPIDEKWPKKKGGNIRWNYTLEALLKCYTFFSNNGKVMELLTWKWQDIQCFIKKNQHDTKDVLEQWSHF